MTNPQFNQFQAQDAIYALAYADGRCFAARASGLYCSEDNGQHWQSAYKKLDFAVEQPLVTTAVAAQGQDIFTGVKGGILRSSNGGADWFTVVLPPPAPLISMLVLSPNYEDDGHLIAGTAEDGVFVSTDRGLHWLPWNFGLLDLSVYAVVYSPEFATDQTIYIGTESGIFRSKNGGRAWRAVPFPMEAAPVISLSFSPESSENRWLFAGTESHGLYVSDDQGATWKYIISDLVTEAINAIVANPTDGSDLWLLLEDQLLVSENLGQTWQRISTNFPPDTEAVAVLPNHESDQAMLIGFADGTMIAVDKKYTRR